MKSKVVNYRDIERKDRFPIYHNTIITLDACPFCGFQGVLNKSGTRWYGWCPVCDTEGPRYWDWNIAADVWNERNLGAVMKGKEIDKQYLIDNEFSFDKFSGESRQYLENID